MVYEQYSDTASSSKSPLYLVFDKEMYQMLIVILTLRRRANNGVLDIGGQQIKQMIDADK